MTGIKRARIEKDSDENAVTFAPKNYEFNFIPKIKPNQKIFDYNLSSNTSQPPSELSANTLTFKFNNRANDQKANESIVSTKSNSLSPQSPSLPILYESRYSKHQDNSYTIIVYIQMIFNVIISSIILYVFINIILAIKQDFSLKFQEHSDELHKEKLTCTNNYIVNQCGQSDRIPAIEEMCNEWAACINRDVVVPKAKAYAEAIAEIINSFVEPISYKTLFFFSVLVIGTLLFSNITISILKRNKKNQ